MTIVVGPSKSHSSYIDWVNLPAGTCVCGGRFLYTNGLGAAFIVAPASTQVGATWNGSTNTLDGNKPSVSNWPSLCTALTNAGLTPSDWFVPSVTQLQCGYDCKQHWGSVPIGYYWSSKETGDTLACVVNLDNCSTINFSKTTTCSVRAFRCVTY